MKFSHVLLLSASFGGLLGLILRIFHQMFPPVSRSFFFVFPHSLNSFRFFYDHLSRNGSNSFTKPPDSLDLFTGMLRLCFKHEVITDFDETPVKPLGRRRRAAAVHTRL